MTADVKQLWTRADAEESADLALSAAGDLWTFILDWMPDAKFKRIDHAMLTEREHAVVHLNLYTGTVTVTMEPAVVDQPANSPSLFTYQRPKP